MATAGIIIVTSVALGGLIAVGTFRWFLDRHGNERPRHLPAHGAGTHSPLDI